MQHSRTTRLLVAAAAFAVGALFIATPAQAVSGSTPAPDGTYKFEAKIMMDGRACTGALIDPQWIITAASCFPENAQGGTPAKPTTVTIGRTNLTSTTGHVVHVTTLVARPDRDLMLARIDAPITDITPIPLGTTAPATGDTVRVAGFGRTTTDWVPDNLSTATFTTGTETDTTLALTSTTGSDTCKGDAGGPAFSESGAQVALVGINSTSWQHGCLSVAETRQGSTETRVDNIADWVKQQIRLRPVQIKNHITGRCLLARASNNVNKAPITQFDCNPPYADQVWDVIPTSNAFQIRNHATGRCLLTTANGSANNAPVVQFDCTPVYADQLWDLVPSTTGYQFRNEITNKCMLARGGANNVNDAPVLQFDCNPPYEDQVWDVIPTPDS